MKQQILTASLFVLMVTFGSLTSVNASGLDESSMSRYIRGEISVQEIRKNTVDRTNTFDCFMSENISINFTKYHYNLVEYPDARGSPFELWEFRICTDESGDWIVIISPGPYSMQAELISCLHRRVSNMEVERDRLANLN